MEVSFQEMINFHKRSKQIQDDTVTTKEMNTDDDNLDVTKNGVVPNTSSGLGVSINDGVQDKEVNRKIRKKFVTPVNKKDIEKSQMLEILKKNKPKTSKYSRRPQDKPVLTSNKMTPETITNCENDPEVVKKLEIVPDDITTHPLDSPSMTQDDIIVSVVTSEVESGASPEDLYICDGQILECVNCELRYTSVNDLNNHQCTAG